MLITIVKDPANIAEHELNEVPDGTILADWLIERYGADGFSVPTRIFSGSISDHSEIHIDDFKRLNAPITRNVYIVHQPLATVAAIFIISLIVGVAISLLIPVPKLPTGERQDKKSPNNALSGQGNVARPLERVPDVFGTVKSFPDLIADTVFEFIDHVLFISEYLCVSRGYLDLSEAKSGDTLISNIVGSSVQIYEPSETPTEILKTTTSNEVKSLTLNPPNDSGVKMDSRFKLSYVPGTDTGIINGLRNAFAEYSVGSSVTMQDLFFSASELELSEIYTVSGARNLSIGLIGKAIRYTISTDEGTIDGNFSGVNAGDLFTVEGGSVVKGASNDPIGNLDGVYVVKSATSSLITLLDVASANNNWLEFSTGSFYPPFGAATGSASVIELLNVSAVESNWTSVPDYSSVLELLTVTDSRLLSPLAFLPDEVQFRGPFVVPGDNLNTEIWLDFSAPRGLARDNNKDFTVSVLVTLEEVDETGTTTGPSFTVPYSFTDNELNPRSYTRKITETDGFQLGKYYQITVERTSNTSLSDETLVDQLKWTRLAGIQDITEPDTSGTTRIQIKTQATEQTSSLQDRKFNVIASRRIVTWNGSGVVGDIETGVGLAASSRMSDVFLHYSLDPALGSRDITGIDVEAIYAIQDSLDAVLDGQLGEFNYTFDNQNTPALEELRQIANAARCSVFREGSLISMVRDERQTISRALFNRRNKKPESESKTIRFNKPLDVDGVQLEYRDSVDSKTKTILLPNDLDSTMPNYGLPNANNPLKVEATGVTNSTQAWNRAHYELNRIIYNRVTVETSVTEEGILLPLNARIDHVDGTALSRTQSNGEILTVNGLTVTTSERCVFEDGQTYSVILRSDTGEPDAAIGVTAIAGNDFGFVLDNAPSFDLFVRGDNDYQVGTLYSFAPDGDELANQYLVQRKQPDSEGNVTLELINYNDKYYQSDEQPAPVTRAFSDGFSEGFE